MIRNTSRQSYASLNDLGARQYQVLQCIHELKTVSNLDISSALNIPINQITPRTNELLKAGLVHEEYTDRHPTTGRLCIYWGLTERGLKLFHHSKIPYGQLMFL